jgi:hypothetical protein
MDEYRGKAEEKVELCRVVAGGLKTRTAKLCNLAVLNPARRSYRQPTEILAVPFLRRVTHLKSAGVALH